jgi:hypothetical protein
VYLSALSTWAWGCATPSARYFAGEAQSCNDVLAAKSYADGHPSNEVGPEQQSELLADTAHCQAEAGSSDADVETLLLESLKLDPKAAGTADAERAALLANAGKLDEAEAKFQLAITEGFHDLDLVLSGKEFEKLRKAPSSEKLLVEMAAAEEPVAPRVRALAEKLGQNPVSMVVVEANPKYGVSTFTVWQGRVLESHYDEGNDETTVLLEELAVHTHEGEGEEHQHFETVWSPESGFVKQPHQHVDEVPEAHEEIEATGRLFGLRLKGFPREVVEAPDLEVVGYYIGRSPFFLKGEQGEAPTLDVVRAVPFNSGVHLGTPVAHEHGHE